MQDAGSEPPQGLQKRRESPRYSDGAVDADAVGDAAVLDAEVKAMRRMLSVGGNCRRALKLAAAWLTFTIAYVLGSVWLASSLKSSASR